MRLPSAIVSFIKLTRKMSLSRSFTGDFDHNTQQQELTESPVAFSLLAFAFSQIFVSFIPLVNLLSTSLVQSYLKEMGETSQKGSPSSSKMRKKNLSAVSLQQCHHFLLGQGEVVQAQAQVCLLRWRRCFQDSDSAQP